MKSETAITYGVREINIFLALKTKEYASVIPIIVNAIIKKGYLRDITIFSVWHTREQKSTIKSDTKQMQKARAVDTNGITDNIKYSIERIIITVVGKVKTTEDITEKSEISPANIDITVIRGIIAKILVAKREIINLTGFTIIW